MGLCFSSIEQADLGIVENFGKFVRIASPGALPSTRVSAGCCDSLSPQQWDVHCYSNTQRDSTRIAGS